MQAVVLVSLLLISFVATHPTEKCALYLQYNGGGAYATVITDQNGNPITGATISYRCGQNNLKVPYSYQVCVECPNSVTATYTATLKDTTRNTAVIPTQSINCVSQTPNTGTHTVCNTPSYQLDAFNNFLITFKLGSHTFTNSKTSGDPHFSGFRGQSFDFQGEKEKVFHILSDPYTSLNALFADPTHTTHKYVTYMTAFGFKYSDLNVVVYANQTDGKIVVNGVQVNLPEATEVKLADCVYALFRKRNQTK